MDSLTINFTINIVDIFGWLITAISVVFLGFQVNNTRRFYQSTFVNQLEQDFLKHAETCYELLSDGKWATDVTLSREDIFHIENYLSFFEKLKLLLDKNVLDMKTLDKMFAYRFFVTLNNPNVQKILENRKNFYELLIYLEQDWRQWRESQGKPIPEEQFISVFQRKD
jgi:hypothetical protein